MPDRELRFEQAYIERQMSNERTQELFNDLDRIGDEMKQLSYEMRGFKYRNLNIKEYQLVTGLYYEEAMAANKIIKGKSISFWEYNNLPHCLKKYYVSGCFYYKVNKQKVRLDGTTLDACIITLQLRKIREGYAIDAEEYFRLPNEYQKFYITDDDRTYQVRALTPKESNWLIDEYNSNSKAIRY